MQTISAFGNRSLDFVLPRNVVTGSREIHFIPFWIEDKVGESLYSSYIWSSGGAVDKYADKVREIGEQLASQSPRKGMKFEFTVVNDKSLNAWCLPGGKIAINIGLLETMEAEQSDVLFDDRIAAVLSHEITHATARHYGRSMELRIMLFVAVKVGHLAVNYFIDQYYNPKIEKHELEADKFGMHLLKKVERRLDSAIWLQDFFEKHNPPHSHSWVSQLFSSHPTSAERKAANEITMKELSVNA